MHIQVKNLSKTYRTVIQKEGIRYSLKNLFHREYDYKTAVDCINFVIESGESVGFIGKNGAGKTTTLKMLSGIIHPTYGSIHIGGFKPLEREYELKRQISLVMGSKFHLWWDLPAVDTFYLHKKIYDIPEENYRKILNQLIDLFQVERLIGVPVKNLSLGERMKMELIAGLLHEPKILFLDEPTIGLDFEAQGAIRSILSEYNRENKTTILMTSHYLEDIDSVSKRLLLIDRGKIIYDGDKEGLGNKIAKDKVIEVTVKDGFMLPESVNHIGEVQKEENKIIITAADRTCRSILGQFIHDENILSIETRKLTFEEMIDHVLSSGGMESNA